MVEERAWRNLVAFLIEDGWGVGSKMRYSSKKIHPVTISSEEAEASIASQ